MYQLQIKDVGPVKSLDITIPKKGIALLVGPNMQGKSTTCDVAGFALFGKLEGDHAGAINQASEFVRNGADIGKVLVSGPGGKTLLQFPDAKFSSDGEAPPRASLYATGQKTIQLLKDADRASLMQQYLETLPTFEDLEAALSRFGIVKTTIDSVWKRIESGGEKGWTKAYDYHVEEGRALKRAWQQASGAPGDYGVKKAVEWLPKGWETDLAGMSAQTLVADLAQEKNILESLLKFEAISDHDYGTLQESFAGLMPAREDLERAKADSEAKQKVYDDALQALRALPEPCMPSAQQTTPCPHCDEPIVIVGKTLAKPRTEELSTDQVVEMQKAITDARAIMEERKAAYAEANNAALDAKNRILAGEKAQARMVEISRQEGSAPQADQVEKQRKQVERAQSRLDAASKKRAADEIHQSITLNQFLIDALAPEGLRAEKLTSALHKFNEEYLKPFCDKAREYDPKWGDVEVTDDLRITLGGREKHLSESAKLRVRVSLQAAFAYYDGSDLLIVDMADMLDKDGRNGLFELLGSLDLPVLVAMTAEGADIIDLKAHDLGITYQLVDGVCREYAKELVAA